MKRILQENKQLIIATIAIFVFISLTLPRSGHGWDTHCWADWSRFIFRTSLDNAYDHTINYMPAYLYILRFYNFLQGNYEDIGKNIMYLKCFTLLFDIAGIYIALRYVKDAGRRLFVFIICFFNIGYLYDTLVWNQVDAIFSCFLFASAVAAMSRKLLGSIICFILALNFKLQGVIFLPVLGLLWLPLFKEKTLKQWIAGAGLVVLIQLVIVLPWLLNGSLKNVVAVATGSVGYYPRLSMNAFNFWHLIAPRHWDLMRVNDGIVMMGLTFKNWGLLLFMLSSFFALLPILLHVYRVFFKQEQRNTDTGKVLIAGSLIPLLFFFFNTEMHERYCHPAMIFLTAYAIYSKRIGPLVLVSVAYTLNLEKVLQYMNLHYGTLIFDTRFIAILFLAGISWLFVLLYKKNNVAETSAEPLLQNGLA